MERLLDTSRLDPLLCSLLKLDPVLGPREFRRVWVYIAIVNAALAAIPTAKQWLG